MDRYEEALSTIDQLLEDKKTDVTLLLSKLHILEKLNRFEDIIIVSSEALKKDPFNANAWEIKTKGHEWLEQWPEAVEGYNTLSKLQKDNIKWLENKFWLHL